MKREEMESEGKDGAPRAEAEHQSGEGGGRGALILGTEDVRRVFCHEGVPLVEARLCFPVFSERAEARTVQFYQSLLAACLAYAEGELFALSRARMETPEGKGARYFHRRLILVHKTEISRVGEFFCVARERRVEYRGHVLTAQRFGEVLDGKGQMRTPRAFPAAKGMGRRLLCGWQRMGFLLDRDGHAILPQ